jgi:DNA-binding MarR family transcriptional regulator
MAKSSQKVQKAREFTHLLFELRSELRQFLQKKFRENNIGLTFEMYQIMSSLWKTDGIKQQELADRTLKDKASLTCLIDNLTKRKLVTRSEDPADRRSKLITLTEKGKNLGNEVEPLVVELYETVSLNFEIKTINECISAIQQMVDNVKSG